MITTSTLYIGCILNVFSFRTLKDTMLRNSFIYNYITSIQLQSDQFRNLKMHAFIYNMYIAKRVSLTKTGFREKNPNAFATFCFLYFIGRYILGSYKCQKEKNAIEGVKKKRMQYFFKLFFISYFFTHFTTDFQQEKKSK